MTAFDLFGSIEKVKDAASLKALDTDDPTIEFATEPELYGAIPEPIPANKVLPEWYKNLEGRMGDGIKQSTVKRCAPFLDALSMGWIIPLAGEVQFNSNGEGNVDYQWGFDRDLISNHSHGQVGGDEFPTFPAPIMKFHNFWAINVPDGYSVLFTKPFNRIETRFQVFSGVVDCDTYYNHINFPFIWSDPEFSGVIPAGTPLIQAIPFKRDGIISDAVVKEMNEDEQAALQKTKTILGSRESAYRNEMWQHKRGSRNIPERD
ncbi:hypothetical protein [Halorubrum sp. LN27]|uniref:hypothetical protein n=1 Tax=Halorubrum sp. LN27 TaxID=2801032 RepID=UPI00190C868E|nr:hypothetical protein [Halorubrum sp. LN27]